MRERNGVPTPTHPAPITEIPELFTASEIAAKWKVSPKTIIRWFEPRIGCPGVYDFGGERTPTETDRRTKYTRLFITAKAAQDFLSEQEHL